VKPLIGLKVLLCASQSWSFRCAAWSRGTRASPGGAVVSSGKALLRQSAFDAAATVKSVWQRRHRARLMGCIKPLSNRDW